MLTQNLLRFTIPVNDTARAQQFYEEKLGFPPARHAMGGMAYQSADGYFVLVETGTGGSAQYSIMTWLVDDIVSMMAALRAKGIVFEEYDFPGMKTVNGLAILGADKLAYFKDSEGNLLALAQLAQV